MVEERAKRPLNHKDRMILTFKTILTCTPLMLYAMYWPTHGDPWSSQRIVSMAIFIVAVFWFWRGAKHIYLKYMDEDTDEGSD